MKKISNEKAPNIVWRPDFFDDLFFNIIGSKIDHKPTEPKEQFINSLTNGKGIREILDLIIEYLNEHKEYYSKNHKSKYISFNFFGAIIFTESRHLRISVIISHSPLALKVSV